MHCQRISAPAFPRTARWSAAGLVMAAVLTACGGSGGGSGSGTAAAPGTLKLALTDAPACGFDHVYVTVEKVRVHQSSSAVDSDDGWSEIRLSSPRRMDLLALTNGVVEELGTSSVPPGKYTQMRLVLAADAAAGSTPTHSVQPTGGSELALTIPSGQTSGIKLQSDFEVASGKATDLVLDFDACKSVVQAGGSGAYHLKPVVSAMPRVPSAIQGTVESTLATGSTTISAQQDGATVRSTTPDSKGNFNIPFLPPGTYTLVISAEDRATGVITGVPVSSGATAVSSATSAITLPTSTMGEISGSLSSTVTDETPAVTAAFTDAEVRALQSLSTGEAIEVRSHQADGVLGTYKLKVPKAAPVKAAYSPAGAPSFAPDAGSAGKYNLDLVVRDDATVATN